jgi:hypothetical protein
MKSHSPLWMRQSGPVFSTYCYYLGYDVSTNYTIVLVLARVFVNSDTQKMYEYLFQNIFPLIEETSGAAVRWQHIHGSGIEAVLVDMCNKQASGKFHSHLFVNS